MNLLVIDKTGMLKPLADAMRMEGDEVSFSHVLPSRLEGKELILTAQTLPKDLGVPVVGGSTFIGPDILQHLLPNVSDLPPDLLLIRWHDAIQGWVGSASAAIPLNGLMNENLGPPESTGIALHHLSPDACLDLFPEPLEIFLKELPYTGYISLSCTLLPDGTLSPKSLHTSLPPLALYALMESIPGRISDFFSLGGKLKESWTVALLVTRYPYPHNSIGERVYIKGLTTGVKKHFWTPYLTSHRNSSYTDRTLVGVATAWAKELTEANRRALRTCRAIDLPLKQYRTDLGTIVHQTWSRLIKLGLTQSPASILPATDHSDCHSLPQVEGSDTPRCSDAPE